MKKTQIKKLNADKLQICNLCLKSVTTQNPNPGDPGTSYSTIYPLFEISSVIYIAFPLSQPLSTPLHTRQLWLHNIHIIPLSMLPWTKTCWQPITMSGTYCIFYYQIIRPTLYILNVPPGTNLLIRSMSIRQAIIQCKKHRYLKTLLRKKAAMRTRKQHQNRKYYTKLFFLTQNHPT